MSLGLEQPNLCKVLLHESVPYTKHSYVKIFSSNPGNRKTGVFSVVRTITVGIRNYPTCNKNEFFE